MCGIAGLIDWNHKLTEQQPVLQAMADTMACRGPDDEGVWISDHAAFAHRRLTVIDPAGGHQPMHVAVGDRHYCITYNGELYNTEEVRQHLLAVGHSFASRSDTEVLLRSYIEWGPDCLSRLNGIFAFGIWDAAHQHLFLGRDRLGVKPLFYSQFGGRFVFGSELKALLAHPALPREVDADGLAELLLIGPARTPGVGVLHGIQELRPGSALIFGRQGLRTWTYWALTSHEHPDDTPTTIATVRGLLEDTVQRQLVSDVPVCTFLSGGLDSSAVSAFAARYLSESGLTLNTYSINFVDQARYFQANAFQKSLDAPWARRVSEFLDTHHHEILVDTPDLVENVGAALRARDLPGMADIDISLLLFSRQVKQGATVALSGEAADEVFGGYPWCHRPDALAADTFPWARRLDDRVALLSAAMRDLLDPHAYVRDRYQDALHEVPRLPSENGAAARIREILYLNLTRFLPTLLDRKDRMTMAAGLEVRVPFCDHRLVEYVWNIPWEMKSLGGHPKGILREAVRGVLPDDVVDRQKSPYPTTHNPSYAEAFRSLMRAVLNDPSSPLGPLVDHERIVALTEADPKSWDLPWFGQMMGVPALFVYLVQLDQWFREYRVTIAP